MTPLQNKLTQPLTNYGDLKNGVHIYFWQNAPERIAHSAKTVGRIGLKLKYLRFERLKYHTYQIWANLKGVRWKFSLFWGDLTRNDPFAFDYDPYTLKQNFMQIRPTLDLYARDEHHSKSLAVREIPFIAYSVGAAIVYETRIALKFDVKPELLTLLSQLLHCVCVQTLRAARAYKKRQSLFVRVWRSISAGTIQNRGFKKYNGSLHAACVEWDFQYTASDFEWCSFLR